MRRRQNKVEGSTILSASAQEEEIGHGGAHDDENDNLDEDDDSK